MVFRRSRLPPPRDVPASGDVVEVVGVQRRPELNGIVGHVLDGEVDSQGCMVIRVSGRGEAVARQHIKVHVSRLRPSESASDLSVPSFMTPPPDAHGAGAAASRTPLGRSRSASQLSDLRRADAGGSALSRSVPGSLGSSALASEVLRMKASSIEGGVHAKKQLFEAQRAAWKRSYVPELVLEMGVRHHRPMHSTDATQFESDFCAATGGVPLHKAYPKEEVVLRDARTGAPAAPWAP